MLNTMSGSSTLPREMIQWLDSLDLSYSVRNPKMDLANGFVIAEILSRKFPSELSILTFYNAQKKEKKIDNWEQIQKCNQIAGTFQAESPSFFCFLAKKKFKLAREDYESITNLAPESAQSFLFRIYQFLTEQSLNIDRRLASTLPVPDEPLYKKPTASYIAKDRELHRVVDHQQKQFQTKTLINKHKNMIQTQKYNTGLIEWLIEKRKEEIHKEVEKQREQIQKRTKSFANVESKVQVKEIELKCFNSSTSKKPKGEHGDVAENKGILDFLAESCSMLFKKQLISNDLKKFGFQFKEKETLHLNLVYQIFNRCDEEDSKGNLKITADTLNRIVDLFKKTSEVSLIVENIHNNFVDFKKFFHLFLKVLRIYDRESETFKLVCNLISTVAKGLHKYDSESAELMFEEILLAELLKIGQNEYKKPVICNICLDFMRKQSECYFSLVHKVKEIYSGNLRLYTGNLAHFIEKMSRECEQIQYNLWSEFFYYGFLGLSNPSPSVRVNGAKIISRLFTDVVVASNEIINQKLSALKNLISDPWWEVRAEAIIIMKAILLSKYKNQSSSEDINENLNAKTILHYITQIFKPDVSHNILRIGLIELAELLNYEHSLCDRYLEILLHVGAQIRSDILNINFIKYGPVVYGSNSFTYKLTGAPLLWNSLGIAKALSSFLTSNGIDKLTQAHLQILFATINKNDKFSENVKEWLEIYLSFKEKIFETLKNQELCELGSAIIKQFMGIKQMHAEVISSSKAQLSRTLSNIYSEGEESKVKGNILSLFSSLVEEQSEYTYNIIKEFAEREKSKYLSSNLIEFMNELSRSRRKRIFHD